VTPDDLVELEQIKRLKYAYVRGVDQKRWDVVASCFTEDAVASYGGGKYRYDGRDAVMGFLERALSDEGMLTSHKVHQPEIELTGDGTATGVWALDDVVVIPAAQLVIRGAAFYEDDYVKVDGAWKIRRTGYKRVYEEMESRPDVRLTASWWGTGGVSEIDA
jgi:ketosteroid isomerase-like protein